MNFRSPVASAGAHVAGQLTTGATISIPLTAPVPYDAAGILHFLQARAIAGIESVGADGAYTRTLRLDSGAASITLRAGGEDAAGTVFCTAIVEDAAGIAPLTARVRRLLDLDTDPREVDRVLSADPALAPGVAATPGIRVAGSVDTEETMFRALIGQQVSVAAARTVLGRLVRALGDDAHSAASPDKLFPTSESIAKRGHEILRGPAKRIAAIIGVASAFASGELVIDPDEPGDQLIPRLTALPGIGPWTAGYVAMRVLNSPDILLTGDLAIRNGAARLGLPNSPGALAAHARTWAPWRSYAGMHLWRATQA